MQVLPIPTGRPVPTLRVHRNFSASGGLANGQFRATVPPSGIAGTAAARAERPRRPRARVGQTSRLGHRAGRIQASFSQGIGRPRESRPRAPSRSPVPG